VASRELEIDLKIKIQFNLFYTVYNANVSIDFISA